MGFSSQGFLMGSQDGSFILNPLLYVDSYDHNLQAPSSSSSSSSSFACFGSQSLSSELVKQKLEMDWFLQLESKRLRRLILEETRRQQAVLMLKHESRIKTLMLEKDEEIAAARDKTMELQGFLRAAEMEARAWERKAAEKEAAVSDLQNRLMTNHGETDGGDDAVSFCDSTSPSSSFYFSLSSIGGGGERSKEKKIMMGGGRGGGGGCKLCQEQGGSLCVVFFPCRHLCCCKSCEPLLGQCPVCHTVKEASLEVFLV